MIFSGDGFHRASPESTCPFRSAICPSADLESKRATYDGVQKMDLLPLELSDWLRIDQDYAFLMSEKKRLIASRHEQVYQSQEQSQPGTAELLGLITDWLIERHPESFEVREGAFIYNKITDQTLSTLNSANPLLVAAQLVAEDLVLLTRDSQGVYRMSAACVCFPSAWSIKAKLGRSVWEIHEPVNNLNKNIGLKIDQLLSNMRPERPLCRINFLINFDPTLSQFPELEDLRAIPKRAHLSMESIGSELWLRNERETLRKLPLSGDIVFTLKTYQTRLSDVPNETIATLLKLHTNLDAEYREYYRKLTPEEHELFLTYCRKRLSL